MNTGEVVLAALAVPEVAATGYLVLLSALSWRGDTPPAVPPHFHFDIVVPAHNEARNVARTVASLLGVDYPRALFNVVVVADNCSDDTAAIAAGAGAGIVLRNDPTKRGKGYALVEAFERSLREGRADAVVVVDADTVVSRNLLLAFAARLELGARAIQADYSVANPRASWRTRLMAIALATVHTLRSTARQRLGLSSGLHGNGMCFSAALLKEVPYRAFSIVEDLEYALRLGEAGYAVEFAPEVRVSGEMPAHERGSRLQRQRWEEGRRQMARRHAWQLFHRGLLRRDWIAFDLALDLLVPPLATLILLGASGLVASAALSWIDGRPSGVLWLWLGCLLGLTVYGLRGWKLSNTGLGGLVTLAVAPAYILWKLTLLRRRSAARRGEWVRTPREGEL